MNPFNAAGSGTFSHMRQQLNDGRANRDGGRGGGRQGVTGRWQGSGRPAQNISSGFLLLRMRRPLPEREGRRADQAVLRNGRVRRSTSTTGEHPDGNRCGDKPVAQRQRLGAKHRLHKRQVDNRQLQEQQHAADQQDAFVAQQASI